jgi:hypothetical protein
MLLLHELENDIVFVWAMDKSGTDIYLDSCELVGVDSTSISVSALNDNVGASPSGEGPRSSNAGHTCSNDDELMNLFHGPQSF